MSDPSNSQATHMGFRNLFDRARVDLPGVSDGALRVQLFDVFTEFFGDSSAWTEAIPFSTVAAQKDYPLTPVAGGQIIRLAGVQDTNVIIQPADMPTVGTVSLRDPPSNVQTFTATVIKNVLAPSDCAREFPFVPDPFVALYLVGLTDGLTGKMMNQPAKSYSNEKLAVYHLRRWRDAISRARIAALRRNTFGVNAWSYPQSFRTRSQRGGVSVGNANEF